MARRKQLGFNLYPSFDDLAAGAFGPRDYEDPLTLAIELDHVLTRADKATLRRLYAGWCERVVKESRDEDDDDEGFERFDAMFVGDKAVQGGASRFITAGKASAWLVGELAKLRGVVAVRFGEPPDEGAPIAAAPVNDAPPKELAKLELVHEGTRMAALSFAITLFAAKPLQRVAPAVLACWKRFLALVPPGRLTLWGTETTSPMNRKRVTTSTLGLLDKWLAKGAPEREYVAFDIGDEPTYSDAPRWRFAAWSSLSSKEQAHYVYLSMPFHLALAGADELAELTRELFATGAFRSAVAGPCWNMGCFSSWTRDGNGHLHAYELTKAYPAIDLQDTVNDAVHVGRDGVKGAAWLTLLDAAFVKELGGRKALERALPKRVTASDAGDGVMLCAGPRPTLEGDGERAVFAAIAPLVQRTLPRTRWLSIPDDDAAPYSLGFRVRLAPWPEVAKSLAYCSLGRELLDAARAKDDAKTRTVFARVAAAFEALRTARIPAGPAVDDRGARQDLLDRRRDELATYIGYAASSAAERRGFALAIWLYEHALALEGAPAELYAALAVRESGNYVLRGLIPICLEATDAKALRRHIPAAAKRAAEQPDIHHALARAYVFLGEPAQAIEQVRLALASYPDAKELKTELPLAPIQKLPEFKALFSRRR